MDIDLGAGIELGSGIDLGIDIERRNTIHKFGYKDGTFIQCLIDYYQMDKLEIIINDEKWESKRKVDNKKSILNKIICVSPTQQMIFEYTGISLPLQRVICNKLKKLNILKIKRKGAPARNWYTLNLSFINKKIYN